MTAPLKIISMADFHANGWPVVPFALKFRSFDIPTTIRRMIMVLPQNCVAVGMNMRGGKAMMIQAERAARRKGIRILWTAY